MALSPSLGPRLPPESSPHPPGAPRELNVAGCVICPASGEERTRPEQAQKLRQDSSDPPDHFQGGLKGTEPTAGSPRLPTPSSHEDPAGGRHGEHTISGLEVLETEQDSLHLCLLGLGLRLQDLERGPGRWVLAQSRMVQLQALQEDLRGAAERVDALLAFGEGLARQSEPRTWASLEQILRALGAHRDAIFQRLWQLQAQLVSYSLDVLALGLSYRKHLAGHRRTSLLRRPQDKKQQARLSLQDVMLEVEPGASAPASRQPLPFLLIFLLVVLFLLGATLLLYLSGGPCCSHSRLARTPYLMLSYVNGPPPV
ncbi:nesprin-4 isoform X3 [Tupaia chinensis]|uniref:nesprin-4 isoform X3 n=1 Tax=Tupaia chinensis TaxID=246437 RepID=UPI000703D214|nr:nesprin-4 isoform X3 [Tupaia chinensis]